MKQTHKPYFEPYFGTKTLLKRKLHRNASVMTGLSFESDAQHPVTVLSPGEAVLAALLATPSNSAAASLRP